IYFRQFVEREHAAFEIIHELRNEHLRNRIAFNNAHHCFSFRHDVVMDIKSHFWRHTDDCTGAEWAKRMDCLFNDRGNACRLYCIMKAATRNCLDFLYHIYIFAIQNMGSTEFLCQFQPVVVYIDCNDIEAACNFRSHYCTQSDGATAKNSNRRAEFRFQAVQYRPGPCLNTASKRPKQG